MSVLIGMVDQKVESKETASWDVNRIGGFPSWLNSPSSREGPACGMCGHPSSLVTQLYCPLGGSAYHRCIYVFACLSDCSRSHKGWHVVRSLRLDQEYEETLPYSSDKEDKWLVGESDTWLEDQDDWGDGSDSWCEDIEDSENANLSKSREDGEACYIEPKQTLVKHSSLSCSDCGVGVMDTDAFAQLRITEEQSQVCAEDSDLMSSTSNDIDSNNCQTESGRPSGGDAPGVTEESAMLVSDEGRVNAVAHLLNTKNPQDLNCNSQPNLQSPDTAPPTHLQPYYLCVVEEPHAPEDVGSDHITELIRTYEKVEGITVDNLVSDGQKLGAKGGSSKEGYEKSELKHGDKVFHKFLKRLQRCPKQCIRYERGGAPMLVKKLGESSSDVIPPCLYCGGRRVFELQLLPPLICSLKLEQGTASPLEFGTVLIFTCEANCWAVGDKPCDLDLREEFLIVQGDPDEHLYR